ncbi:MAG: hypothetical protein AAGD05_19340, partial [Bacteroidota bacterium]
HNRYTMENKSGSRLYLLKVLMAFQLSFNWGGGLGGQLLWAQAEIHWTQTYGGTVTDLIHAGVTDAQGNLMLVGTTGSQDGLIALNRGKRDAWLLKLNESGTLIQSFTYGGSQVDCFKDIQVCPDGQLIIVGESF